MTIIHLLEIVQFRANIDEISYFNTLFTPLFFGIIVLVICGLLPASSRKKLVQVCLVFIWISFGQALVYEISVAYVYTFDIDLKFTLAFFNAFVFPFLLSLYIFKIKKRLGFFTLQGLLFIEVFFLLVIQTHIYI